MPPTPMWCHSCGILPTASLGLVPVDHVRLSPWLLTEKSGEIPLPRAMRSFQQKMMGHRLGISYLSCRALTILQLSGRGGRVQEHAIIWWCPAEIQRSSNEVGAATFHCLGQPLPPCPRLLTLTHPALCIPIQDWLCHQPPAFYLLWNGYNMARANARRWWLLAVTWPWQRQGWCITVT